MKNKKPIQLNSNSHFSIRTTKNNNKLNNTLLQTPKQSNFIKTLRNAVQTPKINQPTHRTVKSNLSQAQIKNDSFADKTFSNVRYKNNIKEKNNKKDNITNISYYKGHKMIPKDNKKEPVTKLVKQKENNLTTKKEDTKKNIIFSPNKVEKKPNLIQTENKKEYKRNNISSGLGKKVVKYENNLKDKKKTNAPITTPMKKIGPEKTNVNRIIKPITTPIKKLVNKKEERKKVVTPIIKMDKKYENKKDLNKTVYTRKKVKKENNLVFKKSEEKKLELIEEINKDRELEKLPSFKKIVILQNLLKEWHSMKERFKINANKMKEEIYLNCYNYFDNKVYMKEIFDYCISRKPEEHTDYKLISDIKDYLNNEIYQSLYDFFFLIRNNNDLVLKIIDLSDESTNKELSDFFVNFFYENIINSSFIQEELMLLIYLLLDDLFLKKSIDKIVNNNIYDLYIKKSFLYHVFLSLTRKIDVRNFLCSIIKDFIIRMESFRNPLSVDLNIVNRFQYKRDGNMHHSFIKMVKGDNEAMKLKRTKQVINKIKNSTSHIDGGSTFLKRANKIRVSDSNILDSDWVVYSKSLTQSKNIDSSNIKNNNESINNSLNRSRTNIDEEIETNSIRNDLALDNLPIVESTSINPIEPKVEIDPFFEENNVNLKYLNSKLLEYRKSFNKNAINFAMKDYLKSLMCQIIYGEKTENNKYRTIFSSKSLDLFNQNDDDFETNEKEIFSTSNLIEELKSTGEIKEADSFKKLMRRLKINHRIVTKIITNLINKIKDNLDSAPYILKYISKILSVFLDKKFSTSSGNKLSHLDIYLFKTNFLIGNFFLPIIINPEYNGIITSSVISKITFENLKVISDVLSKIISGKLFNKNDEPYMTIFNKFIIEIMPQVFELVDHIIKNFKLPKNIQKLIDEKDNEKKDINYNYFKENSNEKIEYQSICFSWQNLYIILQLILKNKKIFIDENDNEEQKLIFEKLLENKDKFTNLFMNQISNKKCEFFLLTKINYQDKLEQKLKSLIDDSFYLIIPRPNNDLITAYKKCLLEVLCYVNIIHKEYFLPFTLRKDEIIFDKYITKLIEKEKRNNMYEDIMNNDVNFTHRKSLNNNLMEKNLKNISLSGDEKEDADFRNVLFPQMLDIVKNEISFNLDNPLSQRIIFCCNYLKMYMRNIPKKYKINNFGLLFIELIKETEQNIKMFESSALFQFYLKIKDAEKLNLMIVNYSSQIRNLEKQKCIEFLYDKIKLPIKLKIEKDEKGIISNIEYQKGSNEQNSKENRGSNIIDYLSNKNQPIKYFINEFPNFRLYEDEFDDILEIEEKANAPQCISSFFNELKEIIKKEKITKRFNKEELESIIFDFEKFILSKMYHKLFPSESTDEDILFYKKCNRLSFINADNIDKNKNLINDNLINKAIEYIDDIDDNLSPSGKMEIIDKAFEIINNSITFNTGKVNLGVDDETKPLIYAMIKSKPKNINSNYKYCELYLNHELSMRKYGLILSQIYMVIKIVKDLKHTDLIGVTEEEFGTDEKIEDIYKNSSDNDEIGEDNKKN